MKVMVYAICKNEAAFAERWMVSMGEADGVYVLDTGSDDGTAERLRALGAVVAEERITPWRFDAARNRSLALVPEDADICVCTDLDESFRPGWRAALEEAWAAGTTRASYRYTWSFRPDGAEDTVFWSDKIHTRQGYRWVHPVHEVLERLPGFGAESRVTAAGVRLEHRPDPAKSRGQYLPLLELSVREAPEDDRNTHYLGREYLYYGRWDDCIRTLKRHLALPSAVWPDERCASMRFIARACVQKGERAEARRWLWRAVGEAPHLRPRPISARAGPGGACPGIFCPSACTAPAGGRRPWRPSGGPWSWSRTTGACAATPPCWRVERQAEISRTKGALRAGQTRRFMIR